MNNEVSPSSQSNSKHPFSYSFTTCFKERAIVEMFGDGPKGKTLEMGCGSAYFATVLRDAFPNSRFEYVGLDMAEEALAAAQGFVGTKGATVQGSVTAMPFSDNEFDDIMYLDVIEHVDDDAASVKEAFRVLKAGGRLIISTPNADALLTDTFFCEYMHDHDHMANQRPGYTAKELGDLLEQPGFQIQKVAYTNVFLSELMITATKLGYRLLKPKYSTQADVVEVSNSPLFSLHKRLFFPLGYALGRAEEIALKPFLNGHCLIMLARKPD